MPNQPLPELKLRELDAWIAEHVMGWKKWVGHIHLEMPIWLTGDMRKEGSSTQSLFCPTTSPAGAIMVLDRCLGKDCSIGIVQSKRYGYKVSSDYVFGDWAETLPLAICLFAKKLFEKENP